jgi:hypothetical protein
MFILSSCQANPYNDQSNKNSSTTTIIDTEKSYDAKVELLYDSYANVIKTEVGTLKVSNRIKLPETLHLPETDSKIYDLTLVQCSDGSKFIYQLSEFLFGRKIDESAYIPMDWGNGSGLLYEDKEINEYMAMTDAGFLYFQNLQNVFSAPRQEMFHVSRTPAPDYTVTLDDSSYSVLQAITLADNFIADKWKFINPDFDYKVNNVYHRRDTATKKDFYTLEIGHYLESVPFYDGVLIPNDNQRYKPKEMQIMMSVFRPNEINVFDNFDGIVNITNKNEINTDIITLQCALDILENKYSEYFVLDLADINIMYYTIYDSDIYRTIEEDKVFYQDQQVGEIFSSRPYWAFTIDTPDSQLKNTDGTITGLYVRKIIFVDLQTGEVIDYMKDNYYGF